MTWSEARAIAAEIMKDLGRRFEGPEVRLILRALSRLHHKDKERTNAMNQPQIIISKMSEDDYQISVSGRYGGGFHGVRKNRQGVIGMLSHLKSYDCGEEPAAVIVPEELEPEFKKVFPKSF